VQHVFSVESRLSVRIGSMVIAPAFLLTAPGLQVHLIEEYLAGFAPAMRRLFNISWSVDSCLMIFVFIGPVRYTLTALGLFKRVPRAGFFMCFIPIGPGVAGFTHFIFPALKPDVQALSRRISSGRCRTRPTHAEPPKPLGARYWALLLSRHVHSNSSNDSRHLRDPQVTYRSPRREEH
jgi:hypothetical protein